MGNRNKVSIENPAIRASMESFHRAHAEILEMLLDSKPLEEIFNRIARLIEDHSPVKAWCVIALVEGADLSVAAAPNVPEKVIQGLRDLKMLCSTQGSCGRAISSGKTVVIENVREDNELSGFHDFSLKTGIQASWTVPVLDKEDQVIAIITSFYHRPHTPELGEIDRAEDLRHLISLAIAKSHDTTQLRENIMRFKSVAAASSDAIWDLDLVEDSIWWNEGFKKLFGFVGDNTGPSLDQWVQRIHPEDRERVRTSLDAATKGKEPFWSEEYRFLKSDGTSALVLDRAQVLFGPGGDPVRMIGGMSDVTHYRAAQQNLTALNRAFQMLSSCNKLLIRAEEEKQLLTEICKIITNIGGYSVAVVNYADGTPEKRIIPIAQVGLEDRLFFSGAYGFAESAPNGHGPGVTALRSGKTVVCDDIANLPDDLVWKEIAKQLGIHSLVCLPLSNDTHTFGYLGLGSSQRNAVGQDERELLEELADNLAFGITSIRERKQKELIQEVIVKVARTVSAGVGKEFFSRLTLNMVNALGATGGLIGRIDPATDFVTSVAHVLHGEIVENITYGLEGTPCQQVASKSVCVFENNLPELFPSDHFLTELGINSYAGIALFGSGPKPVGILSVIFRDPIPDPDLARSILSIFAERAASEMAREQANSRIADQASLLDKARDAIFTCDLSHHLNFWNKSAERLYGYNAAEAQGESVRSLLHKEHESYDLAHSSTLKYGEWLGELHQIGRDGSPIVVESRWNLVRDSGGNPRSILAINTDITEHRKLETQFLRAQRLESIGTLAGGLAHDLNNVLTPITMSIDLLRRSVSDSRGHELLDTIASSSRRGAEMISQILSFARGVEGRRVRVSGKEIISELGSIVRDTFPKTIIIETHLEDNLWPVLGDSTQLNQILLNLCVNARDAMPNGGKIYISATNFAIDEHYAQTHLEARPGPYICIEVEDTGEGIPKEIIGKIYDPFFTTKEIGKGTGLGLSTVLAITKSHGGFIQSYSEPSKGTGFRVYLPAIPDESSLRDTPSPAPAICRGAGETVLVIDDEENILEVTRQILDSFGYQVLTASDGIEGISLFREHSQEIAAVITDMTMPGLDGPATIHAILEINSNAKIIAVSGIRANGEIARAIGNGVRHFVHKPFSAQTILTALNETLVN